MNFSKEELYRLRNAIAIHGVIEDLLGLPTKVSEGIYRFLCPLCNKFQTATNPETNLSRCFRCNKSFNPIDLVIATRKVSFVQSVQTLQSYAEHCNQTQGTRSCERNEQRRGTPVSLAEIMGAALKRKTEEKRRGQISP